MTHPAAPSDANRATTRRCAWAALARYSFLAAATLVLWLVSIEQPNPPAPYLDASWQLALVHAHEQHHVFGRDVIFSAGPLGFLTSLYVLPGTLELKLGWEFAGRLCLAAIVVALAAPLPVVRRGLFIGGVILLGRSFPDTLFTLLLALVVLRWLLPRENPRWRVALALVLLAFLAQFKFTHFLLAAAAVGLAAGTRLLLREPRAAFAIAGSFGAAFLALWLTAGQPLSALPAYVRYSLDFSSGYPWAMSLDETLPVFFTGLATVALAMASCWHISRAARGAERWSAWPVALFLTAFWFFNWKHGFTRGDGHTNGFFIICLLVSLALRGFLAPTLTRWWFDATAPLCIAGIWLAEPSLLRGLPHFFNDRLTNAAHDILHPRALRGEFTAGIERYRAGFDLPALRAAVGNGTVDLLSYEQGLLLINGLRYQPRPVFQSYAAYTPALVQANAAFFARADAPDFVVVRFNTIDHHFPTLDDARVLAELPLRYDVALIESDYVLWKKKPAASRPTRPLTRELISEENVALGAEIFLPAERRHALWLELDCPPSLVGKLRATLYKPGELSMVVTDEDGREVRYRVVPTMARAGFLVQPFLETFQDYALFAGGQGRQWLRSVRVEPAQADQRELWTTVHVRISKVPDLPVQPVGAGVQPDVRFSNVPPLEIRSDVPPVFFRVEGESAALVHAAGLVVFAPAAGTRTLRGGFGLAEGAYTGEGDTDGAQFSVEVVHANGTNEVVWLRVLEPKTKSPDRGLQRFEVALPSDSVRVVLRTQQGPSGKGDWDWTYWTQLEFSP